MSRPPKPKDKIAIPTSFAISEEERREQLLDIYLGATGKGIGEYVRELIKKDQPNRVREIRAAEKSKTVASSISIKYPRTPRKRRPNKI